MECFVVILLIDGFRVIFYNPRISVVLENSIEVTDMLKNVVKFLLIIQVVIVIGIAGKFLLNTELGDSIENIASVPAGMIASQSVYVTDEDGNVQKNSLMGAFIDIKENNMTITGTAKTDSMISVDKGVETVIIENLQQNGHDISISIEEGSGCKVIFKGQNEIYDIFSDSSLTVEGADENAQLMLTNSIYVFKELNIKGGTITSPQLYSDGKMTIEGDSRIYLKPMEDQETDYIYARMESYGKIIIDLTGEGIIEIKGNMENDLYTTYSSSGIELGEGTEITLPENGYAGLWDPEYDDEYCIMDENGEDVDKVIIKAVE